VNPKADQQRNGHTHGKTENIKGTESFAAYDITPSGLEVIFKHGCDLLVMACRTYAAKNVPIC
jgi:hypothetical protein